MVTTEVPLQWGFQSSTNYKYRIHLINSRAYYLKTSKKIKAREFIRVRVLFIGGC